jgi:hypothetical protein
MRRKLLNRLLLIGAAATAGALIAAPTVVGLSGNTSFSRDLRVPVPSGAHHVQPVDFAPSARHSPGDVASTDVTDDHGGDRRPSANAAAPTSTSDDGTSVIEDRHRGGDDRSDRSSDEDRGSDG